MDEAWRGNYACPYAQFAEGRFTWYINDDHRIRVAVAHISNDGSTTLQRDFSFHGTTFPVGGNINSGIDFTYSRLGWTWEFINIDKNTFKFGTVLDTDWVGVFQMTGGRYVRRVFSLSYAAGAQMTDRSAASGSDRIKQLRGILPQDKPFPFLSEPKPLKE